MQHLWDFPFYYYILGVQLTFILTHTNTEKHCFHMKGATHTTYHLRLTHLVSSKVSKLK